MTTCPRCGQTCRPGTLDCPRCGTRLTPMMPVGAPSEAGMPDWLRPLQSNSPGSSALRGGAPPATPAGQYGAPQPPDMFSAGSLVNEDALPEWLREPGMNGPLGHGAGAAGNRGMRPDLDQPSPYAPAQAWAGSAFSGGHYSPPAQQPAAGGMAPGGGAQALFDESALPDWLKEAATGNDIGQQATAYQPAQAPSAAYGSGMAQPPMSAAYGYSPYGAPQPPSTQGFPPSPIDQRWPAPAGAFPSIENAGSFSAGGPSGALNAPSLIDPNALPSWLAGGQPQQAPGSGGLNSSGGMSANSLVDEAALPQWLRAVPPAQASPSAAAYANVPAPAPWTAAADEPLPTWLKQVYVEANVPQSDKLQTPPGYSVGQPMGAGVPGMGGMGAVAASSFVDESALPDWLRSAGGGLTSGNGGYQAPPPAPASEQRMRSTYSPDGATGGGEYSERAAGSFAASDLIDPAVLPSWVHGQEPPPQPSFSSTSGWTSRQRAVSLPATGATRAPDASESSGSRRYGGEGYGNGTAGSGMLMDESNLPVWMRGGQDRRADQDMDTGWNAAGYSDQLPSAAFESGSFDSSDARRRGPPIPSAELPNWLRTGGPTHGGFSGGGQGPARGAYGAGQPQQPTEGWPEQGWPEEEDGGRAAQWNQWDDGQYAEEYGADFDGGYEPQERKRGWRRFFGRG